MRLQLGQKCSSSGAPAPQVRHSTADTLRTGMDSGVMRASDDPARGSRAEGTAASTRLLRVRIVEHEAAGEKRRVVVERRGLQERVALPVDEDLRAVPLENLVAEPGHTLPAECVAQAGTAATLDAHTKPSIADAL